MGYILNAFIARKPELLIIASKYQKAKVFMLRQGIGMITMTDELYDEINDFDISDDIESFTYLNANIQHKIMELINPGMIAYVEAEYFGGQGRQVGILWNNGIKVAFFPHGAINAVLKALGVSALNGMDEFDTMGFGKGRNMEDWYEL